MDEIAKYKLPHTSQHHPARLLCSKAGMQFAYHLNPIQLESARTCLINVLPQDIQNVLVKLQILTFTRHSND
jgi:hypothetical protein